MSAKPKLPFIDYAAVKAATSIEMVLDHYQLIEKAFPPGETSFRCSCPIHAGTDDSEFSVNLVKNLWRCFSRTACNAGGNHLDLVARLEGCTLHEAAWLMNEWFGLGYEKPATKITASRATASPKAETPKPVKPSKSKAVAAVAPVPEVLPEESGENKPLGFVLKDLDPAHPWLTDQGLAVKTIIEFGLGHCPKGIMAGRIVIPIQNAKGELIGNVGRWPGDPPEGKEKYRLPGSFKKTLELFNTHRAFEISDDLPLLIFQNYFPVLKLWQWGYHRAISMMGYALSSTQLGIIQKHVPREGRIILMLPENETFREVGHQAALSLAQHCFVHACEVPSGRDAAETAFEFVGKLVK